MSRYLDPKNDIAFKCVFGDPDNKGRCISLLNAMLPLEPGREVVDIQYLSNEILPLTAVMKPSIADVRCRDNQGRQFVVEMQMEWTSDFTTRILFNASKAFVWQLDVGKDYENAKPVYSLNFINEIFDRAPATAQTYYHHYAIYERERPENKIEGLEFVLVELPKFKPGMDSGHPKRDLWLRFLTEIEEETEIVPPGLSEDRAVRDAVECLERSAFNREQLYWFDKNWDMIRTVRTLSKGKFKDGKAEGRAEEKLETARKMMALGMPLETISTVTGLSPAEIERQTV
jgi:predicted transposase/invertase (TIGR01784 family)